MAEQRRVEGREQVGLGRRGEVDAKARVVEFAVLDPEAEVGGLGWGAGASIENPAPGSVNFGSALYVLVLFV